MVTVDHKDWIILKTIAEEKNITKAAERLYITQPSLSYRLKNLEKEFGAELLLRTTSGIILTAEGEYLLQYALEELKRLAVAKEQLQNMKHTIQGTLQIGSSSIFAHYELPAILKGFLECYPAVDISVKTGMSSHVSKMLQKEEITVAIVRGDHFWPEERCLLMEESLCLVSSQPLNICDLTSLPQISYRTDYQLQEMLQNWWREHFSKPPKINMEVDSMDTCRQMVLHGLGWAILPEIGLKKHMSLYIRGLNWLDNAPVLRRTSLLYRKSSLKLSVVKAFVEYLRNYYALHV